MPVVVRQDQHIASLYRDRLPIGNLRPQVALDHIVIKHKMLGTLQPTTKVLTRDLRDDTPGCGELGMQENATLEANHPQHIRKGIHLGASRRPEQEIRCARHTPTPGSTLYRQHADGHPKAHD